MARSSFVSLACGLLASASVGVALEVTAPTEGTVVVADMTHTVRWTGAEESRFEIDLYYCGSFCMEDECGTWVTALCPYGDLGCPDTQGDYDVVMPEPMSEMIGSGYKVRVADIFDESSMDCSDEFVLLSVDDSTGAGDIITAKGLVVNSPVDGDQAYAGSEYTIEFDYDNGFGSSIDRFSIDLYESSGTGDCGTMVASLCDKPSVGCKDSIGDYDIEIPEETAAGMYKIKVGVFEDPDIFDCSDAFEIVSGSEETTDTSFSFRF